MSKYTTKVAGHRYGVYRDDILVETFAHCGSADAVAYLLEAEYNRGYDEGYAVGTSEEVDEAYCRGYRAGVNDLVTC